MFQSSCMSVPYNPHGLKWTDMQWDETIKNLYYGLKNRL